MNPWKPIESAPRGWKDKNGNHNGRKIDVIAKRWSAKTDKFEYARYTGVHHEVGGCGNEWWVGVPSDWRPVYWMDLPEPPEGLTVVP